jgi:Rod binding domain-containing protein
MDAANLQISSAILASKPSTQVGPAKNAVQAAKAAQDFEAVFINEFLGAMFEGIQTDGPFGGGPGEAIFRSLMLDQYSKTIASQGGFGLADAVKRQLLAVQENAK